YRSPLIHTSGWHVQKMGANWSGYAKFWMDVKSTLATATITVQVEDNLTPHPRSMSRNIQVPAGEWVTVEYDLLTAENMKLLNRGNIASFYVVSTKIGNYTKIYIDNFRLAPEGIAAQFPIVRDTSAWAMLPEPPSSNNNTTRPQPLAPLTTTPDISAIPPEEQVHTITGNGDGGWSNTMHKQERGSSAFDNQHLVNVSTSGPMSIRVSNNGGSTWSGLSAGSNYTVIASGNNTPNRHSFSCSPTEVLGLYLTHCAGGGSPSDIYFRRIAFNGDSWTAENPVIIDYDVRHCPERFDIIRLPNGRIWATWGLYNRFAANSTIARFSDDGGLGWQQGGSNGNIPDDAGSANEHMPTLVAIGQDNVGCLWYKGQNADHVYFSTFNQQNFDDQYASFLQQNISDKIPWDRFAATSAWSVPGYLPQGKTLVSALGTLDGRVFAVVGTPDAILVWDGTAWTTSLSGQTGQLTRCGDSTLLVFWVSTDKHSINYRYLQGNGWSEPQLAVTDTGSIKTIAIPRTSPGNFVPLQWSYTGENNIRSYRMPLPESIVSIKSKESAVLSPLALLQAFPSPFNSLVTITVNAQALGTFSPSGKTAVQLRIYDITGKPVKDFTPEVLNSEKSKTIVWNAKEVSSGIYFIKLIYGNKTVTRKIYLTK
ncbi:MAG: T9SS type A sorting domain-containing protein, partial [Fibrobacterota bacterium]